FSAAVANVSVGMASLVRSSSDKAPRRVVQDESASGMPKAGRRRSGRRARTESSGRCRGGIGALLLVRLLTESPDLLEVLVEIRVVLGVTRELPPGLESPGTPVWGHEHELARGKPLVEHRLYLFNGCLAGVRS